MTVALKIGLITAENNSVLKEPKETSSQLATAEIEQINIYDTVFNFVEKYDPEIKNIKVYGVLDQDGKCQDPYFLATDVIRYIKGLNKKNSERDIKKFTEKETIKKTVNIPQMLNKILINKLVNCNMLTKYGLIRCIAICGNKETKASICFREFIYALFDAIENGNINMTPVLTSYHTEMNSVENQSELKKIDNDETGGIVYFIKNIITNNIKIGRTNDDIETRLSCLQTGNDCELVVIKTIECYSRIIEKELHTKFAEYHVRGEWYKITEEQINELTL